MGLGGRPSLGLGASARCALSSSGGFSNTWSPITSFSRSEVNLIMSVPISLSSGTFMIRRFALRERFSWLSKRSCSASLVAFNAAMSASALARASKFPPAVVSTVLRRFPTHLQFLETILWKAELVPRKT